MDGVVLVENIAAIKQVFIDLTASSSCTKVKAFYPLPLQTDFITSCEVSLLSTLVRPIRLILKTNNKCVQLGVFVVVINLSFLIQPTILFYVSLLHLQFAHSACI